MKTSKVEKIQGFELNAEGHRYELCAFMPVNTDENGSQTCDLWQMRDKLLDIMIRMHLKNAERNWAFSHMRAIMVHMQTNLPWEKLPFLAEITPDGLLSVTKTNMSCTGPVHYASEVTKLNLSTRKSLSSSGVRSDLLQSVVKLLQEYESYPRAEITAAADKAVDSLEFGSDTLSFKYLDAGIEMAHHVNLSAFDGDVTAFAKLIVDRCIPKEETMPVPTKEPSKKLLGLTEDEVMQLLNYAKHGITFEQHSMGFKFVLPSGEQFTALTLKELVSELNRREDILRNRLTANVCLVAGCKLPVQNLQRQVEGMFENPYPLIANLFATSGKHNVKAPDA